MRFPANHPFSATQTFLGKCHFSLAPRTGRAFPAKSVYLLLKAFQKNMCATIYHNILLYNKRRYL